MGYKEDAIKFIEDYLLKDKDFISLFRDYVDSSATMFSPQVVLDRLFEILVPTYNSEITDEERKMFIIYKLFVLACGKRIISSIGNDRGFIDPKTGLTVIIDNNGVSWFNDKGIYLSTVTVDGKTISQLQIVPFTVVEFGDRKTSEYLDWPVKLFYAHENVAANNKYRIVKLKELTWTNILKWFHFGF